MSRESIYKNYKPEVTAPDEISGSAYWFIFFENKMLAKVDNNNYSVPYVNNLSELNIAPVRKQYLGKYLEHHCFSAEIVSDKSLPEGTVLLDLRALYGNLQEDIFLLAGKAYQIVCWDQTHQFCGKCGAATEDLAGERAKICPKCGFTSYPRICPAVITAIRKDDKILLAHARHFKGSMYSLIAGFVEPGETLEEAVQREITEEVGIKVKNIKYFSSQPWPFPNSMMLGFTADYESGDINVDGVEISDAHWFGVDNLPELPSEVSIARKIINWWIDSVKS